MSLPNYNAAMEAVKTSMAAALPTRHVSRALVLAANESVERLSAGVVCLVSQRGGDFARRIGREAQCGRINAAVVGFVQVAEGTTADAVETAELALLGELLAWLDGGVAGVDFVEAVEWRQSAQLEHPFGWVVLELKVKP